MTTMRKKILLTILSVPAVSTFTVLQFKWLGWMIGRQADPTLVWIIAMVAGGVACLGTFAWAVHPD